MEEDLVPYSLHLVGDRFCVTTGFYLPETSGATRFFIFFDPRSRPVPPLFGLYFGETRLRFGLTAVPMSIILVYR